MSVPKPISGVNAAVQEGVPGKGHVPLRELVRTACYLLRCELTWHCVHAESWRRTQQNGAVFYACITATKKLTCYCVFVAAGIDAAVQHSAAGVRTAAQMGCRLHRGAAQASTRNSDCHHHRLQLLPRGVASLT